jgi:hypothetical protein
VHLLDAMKNQLFAPVGVLLLSFDFLHDYQVLLVIRLDGERGSVSRSKRRMAFFHVIGFVLAANLVTLSVVGYAFFRYLTHLMPLLLALLITLP